MAGVIEQTELFGDEQDGQADGQSDGRGLFLELSITDRDLVRELSQFPPGEARDEFALNALRIGMLALRQARGQLDADLIQRETSRMLSSMEHQLTAHSAQVQDRLAGALKDYFDPESGRFSERVKRLVEKDGELERVLRSQIGTQDSELCKTLLNHVGERSPLMKMLGPNESQGLLAALRDTVGEQLKTQRDRVLSEFSLDNKAGALSRLVGELTDKHGELTDKLQGKIDEVIKEFSLDEDNSALSRLVRNVEGAQQTISKEFSLDNQESAFSRLRMMLETTQQAINNNLTLDDERSSLARLKREVTTILSEHQKTNFSFQEEVKVALAKMIAKREESERSTRHGLVFEEAVGEFLSRRCQEKADLFRPTGNETGQIKNCKVGDFVIELGPECQAAGATLVVEAKEVAGYALAEARKEIEKARENRTAQVGLFVISQRTAPPGIERFARFGNDVVVVWNAEDSTTDVYLALGLDLARALCVRIGQQSETQAADFSAIDGAVLEIEKKSNSLEEISKWAATIQSNGEKIQEHVRKAQKSLSRETETLKERIEQLRQTIVSK